MPLNTHKGQSVAALNRAKGQRLATLYSVGWTVGVAGDPWRPYLRP